MIYENPQGTVEIKAKSNGEFSSLIKCILPAVLDLAMMEQPLAPSEEFEQVQEQSRIGFSLGQGVDEEGDNQEG